MIRFINPDSVTGESESAGGLQRRPWALWEKLPLPPLFLIVVVLPTLITTIYFLFIAAPMYVSEARFVVHSSSQQAPSELDSVLVGVGLASASSSTTDAYAVHEYILSREAVHDLEHYHDLRAKLARPAIDFVGRFPRPFEGRSFEDLYESYARFVTVGYNEQTGISTLKVEAFSPRDAQELTSALLDGGEAVINRLNQRASADALSDAKRHIADAEASVATSEAALTTFRNREKLIDPSRSSQTDLELDARLEAQVSALRAQRAALAASAPESPQLPVMDQQILAYQAQADEERLKIAGRDSSLAPLIGEFERLTIDRDFAAKELTVASSAVESARLEMRHKHLYLERIVPPNLPDASRAPKRLLSIALVLGTCLLIYGGLSLIIAGFREHSQD